MQGVQPDATLYTSTNRMKLVQLLFILLFLSTFPGLCNPEKEKDPFAFSESSFEKAKEQDQLLFLFVGSDVCLESRNFLKEIVRDKEYFEFVKDNFVVSIMDIDLNPSLSIRYSLPTIPGFLILDAEANTYFGTTKPDKAEVLPILQTLVDKWENDRSLLQEQLREFQDKARQDFPTSVSQVIDSTMNVPNHISLDLGRYILSLDSNDRHFRQYVDQLLDWIKSENLDFVEGSFFMPRGYCTYHAEAKYSFFNFKLQEMLVDFYARTGIPAFKQTFLKSLKFLKRDLFLDTKDIFSTGYASKKYFKMTLKERLLYYPPSPRRSDLALSQVVYLKILYKIQHLMNKGRIDPSEVEFLKEHLQRKLSYFAYMTDKYQREDGLLYFTSAREFTNFETQVEFFALLQLMQKIEEVKEEVFLRKMTNLYESFFKTFYDERSELFSDIPLNHFEDRPKMYQYSLYFTREHARLLLFLDFLHLKTGESKYKNLKTQIQKTVSMHDQKYPHRFYWMMWYHNLNSRKSQVEK